MPLVVDATSQVLAVDLYLSVPAHDRTGVAPVLVHVGVFGESKDFVHARLTADVVGSAVSGYATASRVVHGEGHMLYIPDDASVSPLFIVISSLVGVELPYRLLVSVGPLRVDAVAQSCTAVFTLAPLRSRPAYASNTIHLYDPPPTPDVVLPPDLSPRFSYILPEYSLEALSDGSSV